jgi:hypothetical protein
MATAAVSSSSLIQQQQTFYQTRLSDLQQLGHALKSGDLAGAQTAYNALTQLGQNGPFSNGNVFHVPQREQDFTAIGNALQNGDLAGAQAAFAALQATGRNNGGAVTATGSGGSVAPEPPVVILNLGNIANGPGTSAGSASYTSASGSGSTPSSGGASASSSGSTALGPEIVINLGSGTSGSAESIALSFSNSSSGGEQLNIAVGNSQGSTEQLQLNNLAQNEQIVLNLFNATANSTPQSNGVSVVA